MFRKIVSMISAVFLLFSAAFAETGGMEVEDELDINDLIKVAEEEKAKDKKDSDGAYIMTVTCTGDFTIGGDNYHKKDIFTPALDAHDGDINFIFQETKDIFMNDDLSIINFEGTFTNTKNVPKSKRENEFLFNIDPVYATVLPDNGIEAVSLDNNHVRDHGEEGLTDTKNALTEAGVIYSTPLEEGIFNYKGIIDVCMLSFHCIDRWGDRFKRKYASEYTDEFLQYDSFDEAVCATITKAKQQYPLVFVSFHWGTEAVYIPTSNQIRLGRAAVDAGADLVIGHHPHRIQPIEYYKGVYILYSLGNFCFAGHSNPRDKSSIIFQIRFRVKNGEVSYKDFRIIPIRISSNKDSNDFIPKPLGDGYSSDSVINTLTDKSNTKGLDYVVRQFPFDWQ